MDTRKNNAETQTETQENSTEQQFAEDINEKYRKLKKKFIKHLLRKGLP